jgi:hypothetical protein
MKQRQEYRMMREGNPKSQMTAERAAQLEGMGFQWEGACVQQQGGQRQRRAERERVGGALPELVAYRERTGHCDVPSNCPENQQLAKWVVKQRYEMRRRA